MATTPAQESAYNLMLSILNGFGLGSLAPMLQTLVKEETDQQVLLYRLRQTPEYKARFPAMEELSRRGTAFTEQDYINYEIRTRQLETQYDLPSGFLSNEERVKGLLLNNVDAEDLTRRVQLNYASSLNAPAEVKEELKRLYGISQGGVAAFFLDPEQSVSYLERVAASTAIAAEGARQDFTIDRERAERLAALGYQQGDARSAFQSAGALTGLTSGTDTVSSADLVDAAFGDVEAGRRVQQTQAARTGRFQGGGGAQAGQEGVVGLGTSSTG